MPPFRLDSAFTPTADQPRAIDAARRAASTAGERFTTLLGATGTGKTMTMAGVIEAVQRPGARDRAQQDARRAALQRVPRPTSPTTRSSTSSPTTTTTSPRPTSRAATSTSRRTRRSTQEIDRLRHAATAARVRPPRRDRRRLGVVHLRPRLARDLRAQHAAPAPRRGGRPRRAAAQARLDPVHAQRHGARARHASACAARRSRSSRPTPRPPTARSLFGDEVERLQHFDPLTGELIADDLEHVAIWPATHYNVATGTIERAVAEIGARARTSAARELEAEGKLLEAHRLRQRTQYDMEMLREVGFCYGIENYSRILDGRAPGDAARTA